MNKYIFSILFLLVVHCGAVEWYSSIDQNLIKQSDKLFLQENTKKHPGFIAALKTFERCLLTKDLAALYQFRTDLYRKTVPETNFRDNVCKPSSLPTRVYFSLEGSSITKDEALIKAYYVTTNIKFETCVETFDKWKFDKTILKWFFVSNTLSWGSPIVIEN